MFLTSTWKLGLSKAVCADYSTQVTKEFIDDILARAQKATSSTLKTKKPYEGFASAQKVQAKGNRKPRRPYFSSQRSGIIEQSPKGSGEYYGKPKSVKIDSSSWPGSANRVTQKSGNVKRVTRRPNNTTLLGNSDIPGVLDDWYAHKNGYKSSNIASGSKKNSKDRDSRSKSLSKRRSTLTIAKKSNTASDFHSGTSTQKPVSNTEIYVPNEPNYLNTLVYSPVILNQLRGPLQVVSFIKDTLRSSGYPILTPTNTNLPHLNDYMTIDSGNFRDYRSGGSLILRKAKLTEKIDLSLDLDAIDSKLLGKYEILRSKTPEDLAKSSRTNTNSNDVKIKIEMIKKNIMNSSLPFHQQQVLYDVCMGLKPVAQLRDL